MLVIIGTGLAGYMLAKELRKVGYTSPLALVTADRGDFYSKPLLSTALTAKKSPADLVITTAAEMETQLQAKIYTHTQVESIDRMQKKIYSSAIHEAGGFLSYNQLVLACGASPVFLQLQGNAAHDLLSVNQLEAYACFREVLGDTKKKIVILGSGLVGCEFANDLLQQHHEVDIVSLDNVPLARSVPAQLGGVFQRAFAERGARWHLGSRVRAIDYNTITPNAKKYRVTLENTAEQYIMADMVFSAVGLSANTRLAHDAGLVVNRGIVVDAHLLTNDPSIFALGDCAEVEGQVKQYVAPLLQCARTLAKVLHGEAESVYYPPMPVVIKTPFCPVVTIPVPEETQGEWQIEGEDLNMKAVFYKSDGQLAGFSLLGNAVCHKMELVKKMQSS